MCTKCPRFDCEKSLYYILRKSTSDSHKYHELHTNKARSRRRCAGGGGGGGWARTPWYFYSCDVTHNHVTWGMFYYYNNILLTPSSSSSSRRSHRQLFRSRSHDFPNRSLMACFSCMRAPLECSSGCCCCCCCCKKFVYFFWSRIVYMYRAALSRISSSIESRQAAAAAAVYVKTSAKNYMLIMVRG